MTRLSLRTITISLVALALPATLLVSAAVTVYFKSTNPDNVDITQSLAYLQQSLLSAVITFGIFATGAVIGVVKMYQRDKNFADAKFPLVLLIAVFVLLGGIVLANGYINKVEDQYLIGSGRPTLQQFFDKLKEQQK